MNLPLLVRRFLLPAAVFQGVIVGGGYGTGREVVEFVSRHGGWGGVIACGVIALSFSAVLAVSFGLAARFRVHDYRHFLQLFLGRGWVLFECLFAVLLVIVIAVVGAAAGRSLTDSWGVPYAEGVGLVLLLIALGSFSGRQFVEKILGLWTAVLMLSLLTLVYHLLPGSLDGRLASVFTDAPQVSGAALSGFQFALYNSAVIPVLIYCAADAEHVGQAATAGLIAGIGGALPALLLHLCFMVHYPGITEQAIPTGWVLQHAAPAWALSWFHVVLFGTVVLTAVGILQGLSERLDGWREDQGRLPYSRRTHALVAAMIVAVSLLLAQFGIIALVAQGYGALSWGFLIVFTVPLLTRGTWLLLQKE